MIRIVTHTIRLTLVLTVTLVVATVMLGIPSIVIRVGLDHGRRMFIRVSVLRVNRRLRRLIHLSVRVGMRGMLPVVHM